VKLRIPLTASAFLAFLLFLATAGWAGADNSYVSPSAKLTHNFQIGEKDFLLDGAPFRIRCGEMHFARVPREYWRNRLQTCRAMGLNTICVYLFWNRQEWTQGNFDWSGANDAAEFCRLAQEEGLWVVLRPGPYSCAEWDGGGLPWWLLKDPTIALRSLDPAFMNPATVYMKEVGRVLAPLQVNRGGPILMVQVENEYGSFGKNADYMWAMREAVIDAGFTVPLFASNGPDQVANAFRSDLFEAVNFGADPAGAFRSLRKVQKTGPLMNGEFYPGWFDSWGKPHQHGNTAQYLKDLEYMLQNNISFSIYMAHGGTSWDLWSGANEPPFSPQTTSYDYDAPISEAGWVTDKFAKTRKLMSRYLAPGEKLPEAPPKNPVISISPFLLKETARLEDNLPAPIADAQPRTMEMYDQGHGCILYRTTLPAGPAAKLSVGELHDIGWCFLDGKQVGVMDRRSYRYSIPLPARAAPAQLDILVEALGHVNYGPHIDDRKGILAPVQLDGQAVANWQIYSFPLDAGELSALHYQSALASGAAFWKGAFQLTKVGDTFLDLRLWGHGVAWVNGHCLGRFWDIGPTQTMYCPGPWLKAGANDVVVLDLVGPRTPRLAGLAQPILGQLHPELDFAH
jgi:beta-galactosidase